MNIEIIIWLVLGAIGLFDIWIVQTGKESISKWAERRWARGVDVAVAVGLIITKTGILGFVGGTYYSFDPVLFMLMGHMLLGHELYDNRTHKIPWSRVERWLVYVSVSFLGSLLVFSVL